MWYTKVPVIPSAININTLVLHCTVGIGERGKFTVLVPVNYGAFGAFREDDVTRVKTRPVKKWSWRWRSEMRWKDRRYDRILYGGVAFFAAFSLDTFFSFSETNPCRYPVTNITPSAYPPPWELCSASRFTSSGTV